MFKLLSLLALPFKMFGNWMDYKTQEVIVRGQITQESIKANVELAHIKKEVHAINQGWWATRWIVPLIAYPVIAWWWMVWIDTMSTSIQWDVPPPPEPIYSWSGEIILSFFIVRGAEILGSAIGRTGVIQAVTSTARNILTRNK
jgi:hypothetical protein